MAIRCLQFSCGVGVMIYETIDNLTRSDPENNFILVDLLVYSTEINEEDRTLLYRVICRSNRVCNRRDYVDFNGHLRYRMVPYIRDTRKGHLENVTLIRYNNTPEDILFDDPIVRDLYRHVDPELRLHVRGD